MRSVPNTSLETLKKICFHQKGIKFEKNAYPDLEFSSARESSPTSGLKPVSRGVTSAIIFRESEERTNIVQRELIPSVASRAFIARRTVATGKSIRRAVYFARFSIASTAEEIRRERGRCRNLHPCRC